MPHPLLIQAWVQLRRISRGSPGTIVAMTTDVVPDGWLECNGRALDSSDPLYAGIASVIGPSAGNPHGDGTTGIGATGSTDFNLPDLRGMFIRGYDNGAAVDVEAGSRTGPISGQAAGDNVGSYQADQVQNHTHSGATTGAAPAVNDNGSAPSSAEGSMASSNNGTTGNETRPANISLMYVIRI